MSSIRDIKNYLDAEIKNVIKSPLYRAKNITIGKPKPPSSYQIESTKNTILEVSYDDRLYVVQYNRRDFMSWFGGNLVPGQYVLVPGGITRTVELLPLINKRWGFDFTESDIVDTELTYKDVNGVRRAIVPFSETNLWFTGQIEVPLLPTVQVAGKEAFPIEWDPRPLLVKNTAGELTREVMCASLLTYNHDYGSQSAILSTITQQGSLSPSTLGSHANNLIVALRAVDKLPWTNYTTAAAGGSAPYNLAGAYCIYNGPTEGYVFMPPVHGQESTYLNNSYHDYDSYVNKAHKNVLVIMLESNNYCSNLNGLLFIHYGGASDVIPPVEYVDPIHYWPLHGDALNVMGGPQFAAPLVWTDVAGIGKMARLTASSRQAFGATLPVTDDYTLQITVSNVGTSPIRDYIFLDAATPTPPGSISTLTDAVALTGGTVEWVAPSYRGLTIVGLETTVVTVVKKGGKYRSYVNGELVVTGTIQNTIAAFTHIYGYPLYTTAVGFSDIYYYDYAMSNDLVKKLARGVYGQR